jgi:signal transduction histidine kinase/CheY-like chemotaxis protein
MVPACVGWIIGVVVVLILGAELGALTTRAERAEFESNVERLKAGAISYLDVQSALISAVGGLYAVTDSTDFNEFTDYLTIVESSTAKSFEGIQAVGWVPLVQLEDIDEVEDELRDSVAGLGAFNIFEIDASGKQTPVRDSTRRRLEFFPLYYLYPLNVENAGALGFDLGSSTDSSDAVETARVENSVVMRTWRSLLPGSATNDKISLLILLSVKNPNPTPGGPPLLEGFAMSYVSFDSMVEVSMRTAFASSADEYIVRVRDKNAPAGEYLFVDDRAEGDAGVDLFAEFHASFEMSDGGATWVWDVAPASAGMGGSEQMVIVFLVVGLLFVTAGMSTFALVRHRSAYRARVRAHDEQVKSRTRERIADLKASEANKRSEAKSRFVSVMSHEIRNPLGGVILNADFLMETNLSPQQRQFTEGITRSSKMLLTIVNDVLDMTKIESGKLEVENIPFSLLDEIEFIAQTSAMAAAEKGIELATHVSPALVANQVSGDPNRIRQILHNLVSNAIKFTKRGHVLVTVKKLPLAESPINDARRASSSRHASGRSMGAGSTRRSSVGSAASHGGAGSTALVSMASTAGSSTTTASGQHVEYAAREYLDPTYLLFEVKDTGRGIPREGQKKLFQEFTQVDESTTRQFGGTGLGLYISKQLANRMDGDIGVESTMDVGSTFWFTVTLDQVPTPCAKRLPQLTAAKGMKVTAIVASEDDAVRMVLRRYLQHYLSDAKMLTVTEHSSPFPVLKELRAKPFSGSASSSHLLLCLYDESILIDEVSRQMAKCPGVVFVALVPPGVPVERRSELKRAGWSRTLQKPVTLLTLGEQLGEWVDAARTLRTATASARSAAAAGRDGDDRVEEVGEADGEAGEGSGDSPAATAKTVLVVDDFETMRNLVSMIVSQQGYAVVTAQNGQEAVDLVETRQFDLCLCDVEMPEKDGHQVAQEIRQLEQMRGTTTPLPIVAMTANAMSSDRDKALASGMTDFASKPLRREAVIALLDKYCGSPHGPTPSYTAATPSTAAAAAPPPADQVLLGGGQSTRKHNKSKRNKKSVA